MRLRVVEPRPLRLVAVGTLMAGLALVLTAGTNVPVVVLGALLLSMSLAVFDGLTERRLGRRQVGLLLVALGISVGVWSSVVVLLLALLAIGDGLAVPTVLLGLSVAAVVVGSRLVLGRFAPRRTAEGRRRSPSPRGRPASRRPPQSKRPWALTRSAS